MKEKLCPSYQEISSLDSVRCSDVQDSLSSLMLINCDSEDTLACVPGSRHTRLQFDLLKYVNLTCCFFSRSSLNMD